VGQTISAFLRTKAAQMATLLLSLQEVTAAGGEARGERSIRKSGVLAVNNGKSAAYTDFNAAYSTKRSGNASMFLSNLSGEGRLQTR
jgi:hypothetical protein